MSEQTEPAKPAERPKIEWPFVAFIGVVLTAVVILVALGQEVGIVVGALVLLITGVGAQAVQTALHRVETRQVKELANGNLSAERERADRAELAAAEDRRLMREELARSHELNIRLAGLLAPNSAAPVINAATAARGDAGHANAP